jgi:hypothetical protein
MIKTVDEFVDSCIDKGISDGNGIANQAKIRIAEIDNEIGRIAALRDEKLLLQDVIRSFDTKQKTARKVRPIINDALSSTEGFSSNQVIIDICQYIEKADSSRTARSITEAVGYANSDPSPVYVGLKALRDSGIISQDSNGMWIRGPKWENKP